MSVTVYVPIDSGALSLGAERVARAIVAEAEKRGLDITIKRNGSRGMYWLEPLVEVETAHGRMAYGPVQAKEVAELFDNGFLEGRPHRLGHGLTEHIPFFAGQERLTFARVGITDPLSLEDYAARGGWEGLARAASLSAADIVKEVTDSGLRGRGGAAFPTGIKWNTVLVAALTSYPLCQGNPHKSLARV